MPEPILPLADAVARLSGKTPIGSVLKSAEWRDVPLALRERAQFSAGVTSLRLLQSVQDRLTGQIGQQREQLANGKQATFDRSSFIDSVRKIGREEGLTPTDPDKVGGMQDITSIPRLGMVFDMQNAMATGNARYKLDQNEGALMLWPAYRLGASSAEKPRGEAYWRAAWEEAGAEVGWEGASQETMVALKTSPIWAALSEFGTPWPPFDYGSTRDLEDVERDEAIALGLITDAWQPPPEGGEQGFNDSLQASVRELDPDMVDQLKKNFGSQVKIEDGVAWWKGDRPGKRLAVGAKAKRSAAPLEPGELPASLEGFKIERELGGSTGATLMQGPQGQRVVRKFGNSPAHVREEFAADSLYRAAGVNVPRARLVKDATGREAKVAEFVEGQPLNQWLKTASPKETAALQAKLQEHLHVDALLANWDVAGTGLDNILVDKAGTPWRIDNGGSLRFRAQGGAKELGEHPLELWSMRDPARGNAESAALFAKADFYQVAERIQKADFAKIIAAAPEDLRPILTRRAEELQSTARKALEYQAAAFKAPHADRITEEIQHLRVAKVAEGIAPKLTNSPNNPTQFLDADGKPFDNLRTAPQPVTAAPAAVDTAQYFHGKIAPAVKNLNYHHGQGDTAYNAGKLAEALAQKKQLEELAKNGSAAQKSMAQQYLGTLDKLAAAKGNPAVKLPQFDPHPNISPRPSAAPAAAEPSVVAKLAEHVKNRGGDWELVRKWADGQASSSGHEQADKLSLWLARRLDVKPKEFWKFPSQDLLKGMGPEAAAKYDRTFEAFHAFMQEMLARTEFQGNDPSARVVRIIRGESRSAGLPAAGTSGTYPRRVNASGSIAKHALGEVPTETTVPHSRITSAYFLERTPGKRDYFLLGDGENEFTYMAHGLKALNVDVRGAKISHDPGPDSTKWPSTLK